MISTDPIYLNIIYNHLLGGTMLVAVVSDKPELREEFCRLIGKENGGEDLVFYSTDSNNRKIWLINPVKYPEKIQPLLQSLSMADLVVLLADELNMKTGEILVAIDSMNIERGIILSKVQLPVGGTVLEKYEKVADMNAAKEKVLSAQAIQAKEEPFGLVHKISNIQTLGNVAFGVLKTGVLKKQDKLYLLPYKKDLEIRSIRLNDSEVETLSAGSYFEIVYNGDLAEQGLLVPLRHDFQIENIVNGRFVKNPFFRDELKGKIYAYSNMQFIEGRLTENDLNLSQPLAFEKGGHILVVDASNQKLRVAGVFQSKW